jgi:hypothetical protein
LPRFGEDDVLEHILTEREPFGPRDAVDTLVGEGCDQLFDRRNLIYAQTSAAARPTYIIGRKGAGKTAFLRGSATRGEVPQEVLRTDSVYAEMVAVLRHYQRVRSPLFAAQVADIWLALFDHVAAYHVCNNNTGDDPPHELQAVWEYLTDGPDWVEGNPTWAAERFLAELDHRIDDDSVRGLTTLIDGSVRGGVEFGTARRALKAVLAARPQPVMIVMDNLEDLHARLFDLREVLSGLFSAITRTIAENSGNRPFGIQLCLPSELWDQIHEVSANPEKDFGGNYLTIYWTARELLRLAATRYRLFMQAHHPWELESLERRVSGGGDVALLRAALPAEVTNGLGGVEDPLAYILRHTQLLPRHLIEILNNVFTAPDPRATPWAITGEAVRLGVRSAEKIIVSGIFAAHRASYEFAPGALKRLTNRLSICFQASELRKVFNQEGITKITGSDYDDFVDMLIAMGVLGVKVSRTHRYNRAQFQYTFNSVLNAQEDIDELCFHPLFTRHLFERSLPRQRELGQLPTYPFGCDPGDGDYRVPLGYSGAGG